MVGYAHCLAFARDPATSFQVEDIPTMRKNIVLGLVRIQMDAAASSSGSSEGSYESNLSRAYDDVQVHRRPSSLPRTLNFTDGGDVEETRLAGKEGRQGLNRSAEVVTVEETRLAEARLAEARLQRLLEAAVVHNGQTQVVRHVEGAVTVTYTITPTVGGMDSTNKVQVRDIVDSNGAPTGRRGLFATTDIDAGEAVGNPSLLVVPHSQVCLLSQYERMHLREASGALADLARTAMAIAVKKKLSAYPPGAVEVEKVYLGGVCARRGGDGPLPTGCVQEAAASFAEEPLCGASSNAVFVDYIGQLVMLTSVKAGDQVSTFSGNDVVERAEGVRAVCKTMAEAPNQLVYTSAVEVLVESCSRTWSLLQGAAAALHTKYDKAKNLTHDAFEAVVTLLKPISALVVSRMRVENTVGEHYTTLYYTILHYTTL
jgi:hypothetical protein